MGKKVFIVTNDKFYPTFNAWKKKNKSSFKVKILNDGTKNNEDRFYKLLIFITIKSKPLLKIYEINKNFQQ